MCVVHLTRLAQKTLRFVVIVSASHNLPGNLHPSVLQATVPLSTACLVSYQLYNVAVPRVVLSGRQSDEVQGWQTQDESISCLYLKESRRTPKHVKTHQLGQTSARQEGSAAHSKDADSQWPRL